MRVTDPKDAPARGKAYDLLRRRADRLAEGVVNLRAIVRIQQRRIIELERQIDTGEGNHEN